MEFVHNFENKSIRNVVDGGGGQSLILARDGSYSWIGGRPASRYQGWFFGLTDGRMLKVIDSVRAKSRGQVLALENNFWNAKIICQELAETFFIFNNDCLAYESSKFSPIGLFLDIKESYQNPEFGRHYQVEIGNDLILINYRQDEDFLLPKVFLAICGDFKNAAVKNEWQNRDYEFDRARGSAPWSRWVFEPVDLEASKLVFVVGVDKESAIAKAKNYWRDFEATKEKLRQEQEAEFVDENKAAKHCAQIALWSFFAPRNESFGLRAGWPWFFQIWPRDEAVALAGLELVDRRAAADIFWRQITELQKADFQADTADAAGWLFLAAADFCKKGRFSQKEILAVGECLEKTIDHLLKNNTRQGFAVNENSQKTWMDSLDRSGEAIEIQALRLNMYSLAADLVANKDRKRYYLQLEDDLANNVRMKFFGYDFVADRFDIDKNEVDKTLRPNLFLAAYIYPELLEKNEWADVFELALGKLWLDWGGLATIDKSDPRFLGRDTGHDPAAYHNGDSWFWVNNIAAIMMARVDKKRFNDYIDKIFEASKNDILWSGALGCASEISSAAAYEPAGCPNQLWSASTFLQLCAQLKK